jgi:hypothetical protein
MGGNKYCRLYEPIVTRKKPFKSTHHLHNFPRKGSSPQRLQAPKAPVPKGSSPQRLQSPKAPVPKVSSPQKLQSPKAPVPKAFSPQRLQSPKAPVPKGSSPHRHTNIWRTVLTFIFTTEFLRESWRFYRTGKGKGKGKAIPVQAWTDPASRRSFRLPFHDMNGVNVASIRVFELRTAG